jgi:enamine deaminase RidA (YjgF/YER057c/UK114 family)
MCVRNCAAWVSKAGVFGVKRGRPDPVVFFLREENDRLEHNRRACSGAVVRLVGPASEEIGKQFLNVGGKKPPGYTHVVTSPPGMTIYISGQGGSADDGKMPPDLNTQARNTFESLKRCLALAGASFKDVVKINYFVTDMGNTTELRRVRSQYLDMEHPVWENIRTRS